LALSRRSSTAGTDNGVLEGPTFSWHVGTTSRQRVKQEVESHQYGVTSLKLTTMGVDPLRIAGAGSLIVDAGSLQGGSGQAGRSVDWGQGWPGSDCDQADGRYDDIWA
jgi:hypothetical protein